MKNILFYKGRKSASCLIQSGPSTQHVYIQVVAENNSSRAIAIPTAVWEEAITNYIKGKFE